MIKQLIKYKGFVCQEDKEGRWQLYTKSEWKQGKGYRYPEHDTCSIEEAKEFIDSY